MGGSGIPRLNPSPATNSGLDHVTVTAIAKHFRSVIRTVNPRSLTTSSPRNSSPMQRTANVGVAVSRVASPGRAPAAPSPRFAPISRFRRGRCGRCGRCGLRVAAFVVPAWRSSLISGGWVWRRQGRRGGVSQCSIPVLTAGGVAPLGCMVASVKPQGRPRSRPRRCHCRRGRGDSSPVSCCRPLAAFPGSIVAVFGAAF